MNYPSCNCPYFWPFMVRTLFFCHDMPTKSLRIPLWFMVDPVNRHESHFFFTRTCSKEHSHSVFYQHFTSNVWKNPPSLDNSHLKKSIFPSKKPHLPPDLPPYLPPLTDVSARPWRIRSPAPPRWRSPAPAPRRVMEKPGSYVGFFLAMDCSWLTWLTYVNLWKFDAEWILMVLNSGWWWLT